ncbi:MAG: AraC family transcriptional regulator [Clostridia bacterium]|jgi:AraC-like DNA-binding protein
MADKKNADNIPVFRIEDNPDGYLMFYIKKYRPDEGTLYLHAHECIQINYVYSGKATHLIHNKRFDLVKGDIFVIPPNVPHQIEPLEASDAKIVEFEFDPKFINEFFNDLKKSESFWDFAYIEPFLVEEDLVRPRLNLVGKMQCETENIFNEALKEYENREPGFELIIRSLLLKLLVLVGREFTKSISKSKTAHIFERHNDAIKGAIRHIEENYTQDLNIDAVAKLFLLSPSFFGYLFKNLTSKTFKEYITGLRIAKASEMLKNTDEKVINICYESGFNNVNHFNRTFKQIIGMTPGQYRKDV